MLPQVVTMPTKKQIQLEKRFVIKSEVKVIIMRVLKQATRLAQVPGKAKVGKMQVWFGVRIKSWSMHLWFIIAQKLMLCTREEKLLAALWRLAENVKSWKNRSIITNRKFCPRSKAFQCMQLPQPNHLRRLPWTKWLMPSQQTLTSKSARRWGM